MGKIVWTKKNVLITAIVAFVVVLASFFCGIFFGMFYMPIDKAEEWSAAKAFDPNDFDSFTMQEGKDFKILQITDTHFNWKEAEAKRTREIVTKMVALTQPDLIVMTGDNISGFNVARAKTMLRFMDSFKIPYMLTIGNHDQDTAWDYGNMNTRLQIGSAYATGEYSLFKRGPVYGSGNYGVLLKNSSDVILRTLFALDVGGAVSKKGGGKTIYDYVHQDQIDYYEWFINGVNNYERANNHMSAEKQVKNMMFYHIPLPETNDLRAEMKEKYPSLEEFCFSENVAPPPSDDGMFAKIVALKTTDYMFFGHDHENLLDYNYQGVNFVYGMKTGNISYGKDRLKNPNINMDIETGGTLITIKPNPEIVTVQFYSHTGVEVKYPGLHDYGSQRAA